MFKINRQQFVLFIKRRIVFPPVWRVDTKRPIYKKKNLQRIFQQFLVHELPDFLQMTIVSANSPLSNGSATATWVASRWWLAWSFRPTTVRLRSKGSSPDLWILLRLPFSRRLGVPCFRRKKLKKNKRKKEDYRPSTG